MPLLESIETKIVQVFVDGEKEVPSRDELSSGANLALWRQRVTNKHVNFSKIGLIIFHRICATIIMQQKYTCGYLLMCLY